MTYSVGSLSEVTSVNSPSCGDVVRASSSHLAYVSFASSFSSSNSSALFSFSQASNQAKIFSFSFLVIWSILSAFFSPLTPSRCLCVLFFIRETIFIFHNPSRKDFPFAVRLGGLMAGLASSPIALLRDLLTVN